MSEQITRTGNMVTTTNPQRETDDSRSYMTSMNDYNAKERTFVQRGLWKSRTVDSQTAKQRETESERESY